MDVVFEGEQHGRLPRTFADADAHACMRACMHACVSVSSSMSMSIPNGEQCGSAARTVTCRSIAVIGIVLKSNGELHPASMHTA
ncbi:hypothetical protein DIE15_05070 [Burkholderia sp. Bp9031]|nr:hypothetical protein DIE15_05070 [Burkholderia sp. Bp9031]